MEASFKEIAQATSLREGPEGVERIFWTIAMEKRWTSKELALQLHLPIPVIAAVRREFEKRGLIRREGGIQLTDTGIQLARTLWGVEGTRTRSCARCGGTGVDPVEFSEETKTTIRRVLSCRPEANVSLDQAHLSEECVLRKSRFLIDLGMILGKEVLFLGDDDFLGLAILLMVQSDFPQDALSHCKVTVLDLDRRIISRISALAAECSLPLHAEVGDVRNALPADLCGRFDVIITDPPYTVGATDVFLNRCIEALKPDSEGTVVLSFGPKANADRLNLQKIWTSKGLALGNLNLGYNRYEGGGVLGGQSDLHILSRTLPTGDETDPLVPAFYTAETGPGSRPYRCIACGRRISVGAKETISTIKDLKESGCPDCGGHTFKYARKDRPQK